VPICVSATPPYVTLVTVVVLTLLTTDTPTISIRLEPVPVVCDQLAVVAVFVVVTKLLLASTTIAAWQMAGRQKRIKSMVEKLILRLHFILIGRAFFKTGHDSGSLTDVCFFIIQQLSSIL
jgi:hypothetical protein